MSRITTGWLARHTPQGPRPLARHPPRGGLRRRQHRHPRGPATQPGRLGDQLRRHFGFLADLDSTEHRIVTGGAGSRNLVLEAIGALPGSRFTSRPLY